MRYRAVAVLLSISSVLFLPPLFAGDHDREKKSPPTQQPQQRPAPQPRTPPPPPRNKAYHPPPPPSRMPHPVGTSSAIHGTAPIRPQHQQSHGPQTIHDRLIREMQVHPTAAMRNQAYQRYRQERNRFVRPAPPLRVTRMQKNQLGRMKIFPRTYHYRRSAFYHAYGWRPRRWVYGFRPRYGMWDAMFLAFALDHMAERQYALMFYHHRHDAEMQQWMGDAQTLAGRNEDLQAKLGALDGQVSNFQESGVEDDPTYVPPEAQDVALSPDVIEKLAAVSGRTEP